MSGTVEHVLWSLETGCESVWLAIEGGGYDGEFSPDYSLDNCIEKDLIQELMHHGCEVCVRYTASYEKSLDKIYMTKILVIHKAKKQTP